MTKHVTLFLSLLFICILGQAQDPEFDIIQLSHPDISRETYGFTEAPSGSVYFFTSKDEIYVSTNDTIQAHPFNCPSFCRMEDIYVASDSVLYIATKMDGLFRYNADGQQNILDAGVTAVAVGQDGTVFAGTDGQGLVIQNGESWVYLTEDDGLPSNKIYDLAIDNSGKLWAASGQGLFSYENGQIDPIAIPGQLSSTFYSLQVSADQAIWVNSAFGGIGAYKAGSWTVFESIFTPGSSTGHIGVSSTGVAWTTKSNGLIRVKDGESITVPYDELGLGSGFIVRGMFMDSEDRLWVSLDFSVKLAVLSEKLVNNIAEQDRFSKSVEAYPNPAHDQLTFNWVQADPRILPTTIQLHNSVGQLLQSYQLDPLQKSMEFDLNDLRPGWYSYSFWKGSEHLTTSRISVQ